MSYLPMEETEVYALACKVSDEIYHLVVKWPILGQNTVGTQLIRAGDSVGANLIEGDARRSDADSARYFRYARSSAREAAHFVRRAAARDLVAPEVAEVLVAELKSCARMINGILRFRQSTGSMVRETTVVYGSGQNHVDEFDGCPSGPMTQRPDDPMTLPLCHSESTLD